MKHSKLYEGLMKIAAKFDAEKPATLPNVLIIGAPGVGKTATIKQVAADLKADVIINHAVVDDPTDYKGLPAMGNEEDGRLVARFLPFGNLEKLLKADKLTICFFDDLGQAPPAVQAAIMQLVWGGEINGQKISPYVWFLSATNRRQDKAAVTGIIEPLIDRQLSVIQLDFDLNDWVLYAINKNLPPVLAAFARFRPELIGQMNQSRDMKKSPTPRSIEGLAHLIDINLMDPEWVNGAVGEGFGNEFLAFYQIWTELPDRDQIYMNPTTAPVPNSSKPGQLYALMGSLAYGAGPRNFEALVTYLERVPREFAVLCVKDALARNSKLKNTKAFIEWASKNEDVLV